MHFNLLLNCNSICIIQHHNVNLFSSILNKVFSIGTKKFIILLLYFLHLHRFQLKIFFNQIFQKKYSYILFKSWDGAEISEDKETSYFSPLLRLLQQSAKSGPKVASKALAYSESVSQLSGDIAETVLQERKLLISLFPFLDVCNTVRKVGIRRLRNELRLEGGVKSFRSFRITAMWFICGGSIVGSYGMETLYSPSFH